MASKCPKAYPPATSKGPPGITATSTWSTFIPTYATLPHTPIPSIQALKASGFFACFTIGMPTTTKRKTENNKNTKKAVKESTFWLLGDNSFHFFFSFMEERITTKSHLGYLPLYCKYFSSQFSCNSIVFHCNFSIYKNQRETSISPFVH